MKNNTIKNKIARQLNGNMDLNRKTLAIKRSWDEVSKVLKVEKDQKKKG